MWHIINDITEILYKVTLNTITPKPYNHIDHERIGISNIYSLFIFPILQQRGKRKTHQQV